MTREELHFSIRLLLRAPDSRALAHIVRSTHPSDLADALSSLSHDQVRDFLQIMDPEPRAAVISYLPQQAQDKLLRGLPRDALIALFERLPADDRADLFNRLSSEARDRLLPALAKAEREDILRLASYPDDTVGSVTTSDYVHVSPDLSVADALAHVRSTAPDKETIYVIYVLDASNRLVGTLSLRELVLADEQRVVGELMRRDPVFARAHWPRAQASELIRRYGLLALPVIDGSDRMIGIVTVDDAMEIEKADDATQLARFGGAGTLGGPDLDLVNSSISTMLRTRLFWLVMLTVFGIITSTFVAAQEEILSKAIVLAAFIAPIVDMGGNTGSQSATLVIRAMALGQLRLRWRDVWFVIKRELPVAAALGIVIALLEVVLAWFSKGVGLDVLAVVGLSMLACTALGGIIGALLPFAARRVGTDPATLSSPLITSIMDLVGVMIYFGFAYAFMGDLLIGAVG